MAYVISPDTIRINNVAEVARNNTQVVLSSEAKSKILRARKSIESAVNEGRIIYGVTTGFGAFKGVPIDEQKTKILQKNLIISHAVGVGNPFPTEVVRGMMLLIINYLSKGHSGASLQTVQTLVDMLNKGVHPIVPQKGSVGSSGDLAPSAHIALVIIGKGQAEYKGKTMPGDAAMKKAGILPITLSSKEGLALINNTAAMCSVASLTLRDFNLILKIADISTALSIQALRGTDRAYNEKVHALKPHKGQITSAQNLRNLLRGSTFIDNTRIQEAYSFRCAPQIHGAVRETYDYASRVIETEINSVTDNPLIFVDDELEVISGGNFHGEPVAIAMDALGIAISEIGNISDRRIATLLDPATNNGLPPFLIKQGGINSGLMILQYTTAALTSENKVLAHPAAVDSIPTSANVEDLVSMGTISARKAKEILENTMMTLTIELLVACQGIDLRALSLNQKPKLGKQSKQAYQLVRSIVPFFQKDIQYQKYFDPLRTILPTIADTL